MPWIGVMGIESESKKLTWWGFFADGSAGPIYLVESTDTMWVFAGDGVGPDGMTKRRVTVKRTGDASLHAKVEDTVDGEAPLVEESDWVRHR